MPVKIALRIEPRDISPCWLMHKSQFFVILVEIGFPVVGYRPRGSVCPNGGWYSRGRSWFMSSFSRSKSRMILFPSVSNAAESSALMVSCTSAMTLSRSLGHRSWLSFAKEWRSPLTVLYANEERSPVEYGAVYQIQQ